MWHTNSVIISCAIFICLCPYCSYFHVPACFQEAYPSSLIWYHGTTIKARCRNNGRSSSRSHRHITEVRYRAGTSYRIRLCSFLCLRTFLPIVYTEKALVKFCQLKLSNAKQSDLRILINNTLCGIGLDMLLKASQIFFVIKFICLRICIDGEGKWQHSLILSQIPCTDVLSVSFKTETNRRNVNRSKFLIYFKHTFPFVD